MGVLVTTVLLKSRSLTYYSQLRTNETNTYVKSLRSRNRCIESERAVAFPNNAIPIPIQCHGETQLTKQFSHALECKVFVIVVTALDGSFPILKSHDSS